MKILVSACLLGKNVKYNGKNNKNDDLIEFLKNHEVVSVCPEVMGGLLIPRIPSEISDGVVYNKVGENVDKEFHIGAQTALDIAINECVDVAVLQSRSPSCGIGRVYSGNFDGKLVEGDGVFASLLKQHGIRVVDVENMEELKK